MPTSAFTTCPQVICEGETADGESDCRETKTVKPVALCDFTVGLWNLGGTCISHHLEGLEFPDCPTGPRAQAMPDIARKCRDAVDAEQNPEKAKVEQAHCTRLAMSY